MMKRPTKKPPTITEQIRAMKPRQPPLFFAMSVINSVKAIASRIGSTTSPTRKYVTEQGFSDDGKQTPGVWVWRLK